MQLSSPTRYLPALPPSTQPLLCQYCLCLFGSPHLQARRRQQRTGAADTMAKSCSGGRVKRSILFHILLNKEPSLVAGLSQTALGGNRNPEESGEESGVNTGIPAHRNSCEKFLWLRKKTEIPATSSKPRSCEKFLRKTQENNPQESWQEHFFVQKINF